MRPTDRLSLAVGGSMVLASLTARQLTTDSSYLGLSWLLIGLLVAAGLGLRRLSLGPVVVLEAQLLVVLLFSLLTALSMPAVDGAAVRPPWFQHYPALWQAGIQHMQGQASPMPPNDGVRLIFVTVIGVIAVVTDLLVLGIGRAAWGVVPPGTLFLVPALGLNYDTGLLSFGCIALGYLGILVAEGLNRTARWPRGLSRDSAEGFGTATPVVWRAAGLVGAPTLVGAVALGLVVPTFTLPGLGFGSGPGGNGPLQLTDPTLDLRRNLNQPDDRIVIEYQTNRPGGSYLRLATLPQLSASGFSSVQIRLNTGRTLPAVPGLDRQPTDLQDTTIRVLDFGSQYLPLPYAPRSYDTEGDWRWDPNSLVVVNAENQPGDLRRTTYRVQSVPVEPDGRDLDQARAGTPADASVTAVLPRDLPQDLIDLTREVTRNADSDAAKAAAIQAFLRSDRFSYSLDDFPGGGYDALQDFLLRNRRGFCEQFAAAMAVMARVVGIPSRVSVGFLPGELDDDTWKVSIRKMHAWPELYFERWGWVRFEPTPASVTGAAPPWTVRAPSGTSSEPTLDPTSAPSSAAPTESTDPNAEPSDAPVTTPTGGLGTGRTILLMLGALVGLTVLAAPATLRVRRRARRLHADAPPEDRVEGAWAEIRDTVVDYGGQWPRGTPRTIGGEVGRQLEADQARAMGQVATLVERSRYARSLGELEDGLPRLTEDVRRGLAAGASRPRRVRAFLFPRSLFRALRPRRGEKPKD